MSDNRANANEGADLSSDIDKQNPGETTTSDLTGGHDDRSDGEPTEAEEAEEMEKVQKDAAEEREENGGYQ
ncbi:hypothetical protein [Sphingomonas panacis]|nr:hypothetical protein [Sphingomonas panacis]